MFVCLSVRWLPAFLEIGSSVFPDFGTMMQNGNAQNVTEPDFRKKIHFRSKMPEKTVFGNFLEISSLVFSDFFSIMMRISNAKNMAESDF